MEPAMKQRLLGAAVIIGLAVIILPLLLDGSGTRDIEEIPPPPEPETAQTGPIVRDDRVPVPPPRAESEGAAPFEPPVTPEPEPATPEPAVPEQVPTPPPAPAPQQPPESAAQPAPQAAAPPAVPEKAPPPADVSGWVVQVGSFSERDKAVALRDRLQAAGFDGFTDAFAAGDGKTMYRVRIGPVEARAEADRLHRRLKAEQKLDGYVTRQP